MGTRSTESWLRWVRHGDALADLYCAMYTMPCTRHIRDSTVKTRTVKDPTVKDSSGRRTTDTAVSSTPGPGIDTRTQKGCQTARHCSSLDTHTHSVTHDTLLLYHSRLWHFTGDGRWPWQRPAGSPWSYQGAGRHGGAVRRKTKKSPRVAWSDGELHNCLTPPPAGMDQHRSQQKNHRGGGGVGIGLSEGHGSPQARNPLIPSKRHSRA